MKAAKAATCPCGKGIYAACCEPLHKGAAAVDAEALMRSRYTAYVLKLVPYLRDTWHAGTRPADLTLEDDDTKWIGLEVRRHASQDETATVEFIARYKVNGRAHRLHEISRFVREPVPGEETPHWFYVDGELLQP